jgi:hypothetical protein
MEPTMISRRVLSTAAALALVLPMAAPTASFAEPPHVGRGAPVGGLRVGGGAPVARFGAGGGVYRGGYRRGGGGFIPGAVAGAVIGGAIASAPYGYYGGPGYYDDQYYDEGPVVVAVRSGMMTRSLIACRPIDPTIRSREPIWATTACGTPARN